MRRSFYLVFNRSAGTSRVHAVGRLIEALRAAGAVVVEAPLGTMLEVRAAAAAAARSGQYDALIACGGDGTVRQLAIAAAGTSCPVAACMLGTGNVLAHELGLPRAPKALAHAIMHAATLDVRMGLANGEPFLLMAGVGFDGRVISHLNQTLKQRVAKLAYVPASLKAIRAPLDVLSVAIDGGAAEQANWAVVTSASRYGGAFRLTERTSLRTPGLVAILFDGTRRADLIRHNVDIVLGRLDRMTTVDGQGVRMRPARRVRIEAADVPVQVDGDAFGSTPLLVEDEGPLVRLIGAA
jgi:diacylglycerol kinase (ATP)